MPGDKIRVKISFKHISTAVHIDSRAKFCWYLVDTSAQKTIQELAVDIKKKFFSTLPDHVDCTLLCFIDDSWLPTWESTEILREGDSIRLEPREDELFTKKTDKTENKQKKSKKRKIEDRDVEPSISESTLNFKKQKHSSDNILAVDHKTTSNNDTIKPKHKKKHKNKLLDKPETNEPSTFTDHGSPQQKISTENLDSSKQQSSILESSFKDVSIEHDLSKQDNSSPNKRKKKQRVRKRKSSTRSSTVLGDQHNNCANYPTATSNNTSKSPFFIPHYLRKSQAAAVATTTTSNGLGTHIVFESDSDSEKNDSNLAKAVELGSLDKLRPHESPKSPGQNNCEVIRDIEPPPSFSSTIQYNKLLNSSTPVPVYIRKNKSSNFHYPLTKESQLSTVNTNRSFIFKNDTKEDTSTPVSDIVEKDYTQFVELHGPPRPGDKIAYKVLEVNEEYCPVVSDYKEAIVNSYDPISREIEVEVCQNTNKKKKDGIFDLTVEDEDEILTNVADEVSKVKLTFTSLIEPRLITDTVQAVVSSTPGTKAGQKETITVEETE